MTATSPSRLRSLGGLAALGAALLLAAGLLRLHPATPLDGVTVAPGKVFSFNRAVRGWSADQGFLRAPVSYDGVLVGDYGGGVCETSTTVYNAALRAGLPILERHAHTFAPGYAPPGRDAAVAYAGVDLRFRNPYPQPLTLHVRPEGHRLVCRIEMARILRTGGEQVVIRSETLDRFRDLRPGPSRRGRAPFALAPARAGRHARGRLPGLLRGGQVRPPRGGFGRHLPAHLAGRVGDAVTYRVTHPPGPAASRVVPGAAERPCAGRCPR